MWTVERLRAQAEMFGLIGRWDSWIGPWLEFMAALLNAYQHPDLMDAAADFTVGMMMMELREPRSAEDFRRAVCEGIAGSFGIAAGPQVGRVPAPADAAPAAPAAPPSPGRFIPPADDLRTPTALERGLRIARFAERQGGRFRWLPRGEEGGLPVQTTGHSHSGRGVNHFWLWVQGPATELPVDSSLNCWEFVLYCATAAGALSRGRLRAAYEGAALSARKEFGGPRLHLPGLVSPRYAGHESLDPEGRASHDHPAAGPLRRKAQGDDPPLSVLGSHPPPHTRRPRRENARDRPHRSHGCGVRSPSCPST